MGPSDSRGIVSSSEGVSYFQVHEKLLGDLAQTLAEPLQRQFVRRLPFKRPGEKEPAAYIPGEFVILDLNETLPLLWSSRVTNVAYPEPLTQRSVICPQCDPAAQQPKVRDRCMGCVNCKTCDGKPAEARKSCKDCTNGRTGRIMRWFCTAAVTLRIIVGPITSPWVEREDVGTCSATNQVDPGAAADLATKGATTDALKRAAALLGVRFGLALRFRREEQDMLGLAVGEEPRDEKLGAVRGKQQAQAPAGNRRPQPTSSPPARSSATTQASQATPVGAPSTGARSTYQYPRGIKQDEAPAATVGGNVAGSVAAASVVASSSEPEPFACTICGAEKPSVNSVCPEAAHHPKVVLDRLGVANVGGVPTSAEADEALAAVGIVSDAKTDTKPRIVSLLQGGHDPFACLTCGGAFFRPIDKALRRYGCTGCGAAFDAEAGDTEVLADPTSLSVSSVVVPDGPTTDQDTTISTPATPASDVSGTDADMNLVPEHLRNGVTDLDAPLSNALLNDLHAVLVDRAGSRPKARVALNAQGVKVEKGAVVTMRQFLGAFRAISLVASEGKRS